MNSYQLKDAPIMISISFLAFILCRSTVSKPNLARSDLLLEGKLKSRLRFRGGKLFKFFCKGLSQLEKLAAQKYSF